VLGSASTFTGRYACKLLALETREKHQRKKKFVRSPFRDLALEEYVENPVIRKKFSAS